MVLINKCTIQAPVAGTIRRLCYNPLYLKFLFPLCLARGIRKSHVPRRIHICLGTFVPLFFMGDGSYTELKRKDPIYIPYTSPRFYSNWYCDRHCAIKRNINVSKESNVLHPVLHLRQPRELRRTQRGTEYWILNTNIRK